MTQDTEDVVARLRAKATWNDYSSCDRDDFVEAADLIQSLSDRIDVQVEAAYREGWHEGYATGDAGGSYQAVENDWFASDARAALHQEDITPKP